MASSILNSDDGVISGTSGLKSTGGNDGVLVFQSKGTETMRIDTSGNVGIGTNSPSCALDVVSSSSTAQRIRSTTNNSAYTLYQNSDTGTTNIDGLYVGYEAGTAYLWNFENSSLVFAANNAARMSIDSSGNVTLQNNISVGGAAPTTSGTGITFPATASASTNANTLDDYEEGTWTPTATAETGSITTYTASGTYTKIGRLVLATANINISSVGTAAGALSITNQPFGPIAASGSGSAANGSNGTALSVIISSGFSNIDLRKVDGTTPFANNTYLVSVVYNV